MTIQDLGSAGEFVAALATLITLIYLALQIRTNTRIIQAESQRGHANTSNVLAATLGANKEAASIFRRGLSEPDTLDPDERIQFAFLFIPLVTQAHNAFQDYHLGITDEERFEAVADHVITMLKTPGGRNWWKFNSSAHLPEFRAYVEARLHLPA